MLGSVVALVVIAGSFAAVSRQEAGLEAFTRALASYVATREAASGSHASEQYVCSRRLVPDTHPDRHAALRIGRLEQAVQQLSLLRRGEVALILRHTNPADKREAVAEKRLHAETLFRTVAVGDVERPFAEPGIEVDADPADIHGQSRDRKHELPILDGCRLALRGSTRRGRDGQDCSCDNACGHAHIHSFDLATR